MEERELLAKIDNLEKRVEALEKEISTIVQINQSERVKKYIASAEKARKIASLLDISSKNYDVDDLKSDKPDLSEILLDKPEMHVLDEAKEYVDNIENNLVEEIENNNKVSNAYDWDSLFEYEEADGNITITNYIGFDDMDTVVIPDSINGFPVTSIGEKAFENCKSIKEVVLSQYLKTIGNRAFYGSGITAVSLPESLIHIGKNAFTLTKLKRIFIPSNVDKIAEATFSQCADLKEVFFSTGIISIEKDAFRSSGIFKIDIPNSVKTIGEGAFDIRVAVCSNVCIRMPDSIEWIDDGMCSYFKPIIYCNAGSVAMKYARKNSIPVKRYEEFDLLEE